MKNFHILFFLGWSSLVFPCESGIGVPDTFNKYVKSINYFKGKFLENGLKECDDILLHLKDPNKTGNLILRSILVTVISNDGKEIISQYTANIDEVSKSSKIANFCISENHLSNSSITFLMSPKPVETVQDDGSISVSGMACLEETKFENIEFLREDS